MKKIASFIILFNLVIFSLILNINAESETSLTLGEITNYNTQNIEDVVYEHYSIKDTKGRPQQVYNAKFNPLDSNVEMVLHDMMDRGNKTVLAIAEDYEAKTGRKVYAAINGDFFWAGNTIDHYIKDSEVISNGSGNDQSINFGFNNEGEYVFGKVPNTYSYTMRIYNDNGSITNLKVDKLHGGFPFEGEISIYSSGQSMISENSSKYLVKMSDQSLEDKYNLPLKGIVERDSNFIIKNDEVISVPEGYFGIVIHSEDKNNPKMNLLERKLKNGTQVDIIKSPGGDFSKMTFGVGGKNILVKNNIVMPDPFKDGSSGKSSQPRTTVGVNHDGSFFISVIDGRSASHSVGLTVEEQGQLAYDLGAKDAIELDGGGSSTFIIRNNDKLEVVNRPSDGNLRGVINAVLFVETPEEVIEDEEIIDKDEDIIEEDKKNRETLKIILTSLGVVLLVGMVITFTTIIYNRNKQ